MSVSATMKATENPTHAPPRRVLHALTGTRFIAAAAVLFFHFTFVCNIPSGIWHFAWHGRAGVCFFFVLSGFILTYNYAHWFLDGSIGPAQFRRFSQARFARIFPMQFFALCAITPLVIHILRTNPRIVWAADHSSAATAGSWLASALMLQTWVPSIDLADMWNAPAWSIACEVVFYVAFPFFTAWIVSRLRKSLTSILALASLCLIIQWLLLVATVWIISRHSPPSESRGLVFFIAYRMPFFRIWEFFIGCCVGAIHLWHSPPAFRRLRVRNALLALALAAAAVLILASALQLPHTQLLHWYVFYTPIFAVVIFCLASGTTFLSPILESRLLILLGEASYSLYLIHWFPLLLIRAHPAFQRENKAPGWLVIALSLICVGLSIICLKWIETPARRWLQPRKDPAFSRSASIDPAPASP